MLNFLFSPSAWREQFKQNHPELPANFTLPGLNGLHWQDPVLRRFLLACIGDLLATALSITLLLWISGQPRQSLQLAWVCGIAWHLTTGLAFALWVSVPAGRIAGLTGGLLSGLMLCGLHGGILGVLAGALFAVGVGGSALLTLREAALPATAWREIGAVPAGLAAGGLVAGAGYLLADGLISSGVSAWNVDYADWHLFIMALLGGGFLAGVSQGNPGWRIAGFMLCAGVFAAVLTKPGWLDVSRPGLLVFHDALLAAELALLSSSVFALGFVPAARLGGTRAGVVAGCLALLAAAVWIATIDNDVFQILLLPTALFAGLSQTLWRSALFYPLLELWHGLLLLLEIRTDSTHRDGPRYLERHGFFWDEKQRLPWLSLSAYLQFLDRHYPATARRWLVQLQDTRQAWAIAAFRQQADIRRLHEARSLEMMARVHEALYADRGAYPEQGVIRRFQAISHDLAVALKHHSSYTRRLLLHESEENLERLILDINRDRGGLRRRLQTPALQWQACLAKTLTELDNRLQHSDKIPNPYVVGIPLTAKQEIFVGRRDISERLEEVLRQQHAPPVLIYAQRRMGKTSLLNNLSRLLAGRFVFAYLDFQSPRMLSGKPASMLEGLVFAVRAALQQAVPQPCPALDKDALQDDPLTAFAAWLDAVDALLQTRTLLLALDEFVVLEDIRMPADSLNSLLGLFRHIIQHRPAWRLLFAGSHALEELRHWSGYLVNVQVVHLGVLSPAEARALIATPVPDFPLHYQDTAVTRVLALTGCHPALVQLLCSEIVRGKNSQAEETRYTVSAEDVESAAGQALETGIFYFNDMLYNQVGRETLAVLRYIAGYGEGKTVEQAALREHFGAGVEEALSSALRRELLVKTTPGYGFSVELIRRAAMGG